MGVEEGGFTQAGRSGLIPTDDCRLYGSQIPTLVRNADCTVCCQKRLISLTRPNSSAWKHGACGVPEDGLTDSFHSHILWLVRSLLKVSQIPTGRYQGV